MAKKSNTKWIVGGVVVAGAVITMSFLNLGQNLIYFYTPAEAVAKAGELSSQTIKVGGMVQAGTVNWVPENLSLKFTMTDYEGHDINVAHKGTPPDMFKEGQGVVVEGRLASDGKSMTSHHLLVKHSESYEAPKDGEKMDHELLKKSLFKNQDKKPAGSTNE